MSIFQKNFYHFLKLQSDKINLILAIYLKKSWIYNRDLSKLKISKLWWQQQGKTACLHCPQVVTDNYKPSEQIRPVAKSAIV